MLRNVLSVLGAAALLLSVDISANELETGTKKLLTQGKDNFYYAAGFHFNKFQVNDRVLYACDSLGNTIVIMDAKTGNVLESFPTIIPTPDDLDIGPDVTLDSAGISRGTIYYTSSAFAGIGRIHPDGSQDVIVADLPNTNGISFSRDGFHLYISQVFHFPTNGVYEVMDFGDPNPANPFTHTILTTIDSPGGGLEGFVTGTDGFIYGPLFFTGTLVKLDPATGDTTEIPSNKVPLYGAAHTALDSDGRLLVCDLAGRLIRVNNLETGSSQVLTNSQTIIDTVSVNSKDKIYFSTADLGGIKTLKRDIIKPGFVGSGFAISGNDLYISNDFLCGVYDKQGNLQKNITQHDWMPSPAQLNFETMVTFADLAPMGKDKLIASTFFPSGRLSIFDIKSKDKISQLAQILTQPGPGLPFPGIEVPFATIALDDHTLIMCGINLSIDATFVQKIILNDDFSVNSVTAIPVTVELPVALAKSPDGSQVWVSDYALGTITEIFSNTVVASNIAQPQGIALAKDKKHLFYLEEQTQTLKSIDLRDLAAPPVIVANNLGLLNVNPPLGPRIVPQGIISGVSVDPKTGHIFVVASGAKRLWKIKAK